MRIISENKFFSFKFAFLFSLRFLCVARMCPRVPPSEKKEEKEKEF